HPSEVVVSIAPSVIYHSVVWGEIGYERWGGEKVYFSVSHEEPENIDERVRWIVQDIVTATNISLYFGKDMVGEGKDATHLYGAYYRLWGGVSPDKGDFVSGNSYFESRYILRNAVRLGVHQPLYGEWFGKRWRSGLAMTYDIDLHGVMVTSNLDVQWSPSLNVSLVGDFVGLTDSGAEGEISNFFANYRSNDKVQLRFSYVY
ncbi:hypothetical protein OAQ84_01980, partial [Bdellovibrionales bacterium]|nr:hypothetical protein [Bdellovibrionales bacterium]